MPRIDFQQKLDFNQVLITPKRSNLNSRSEVELERQFVFKNGTTWKGIPIICANMSSTGTFEVYNVLSKYKIITAFHKFYSCEDYKNYFEKCNKNGSPMNPDYFMVSTGITDRNFENMCSIVEETGCKWICIDIANGYIDKFVAYCQKVRARWPDKILVAGNIATREMVEELIKIVREYK